MITVLYHGNCDDGFVAACCLAPDAPDDTVFVPCTYGRPIAVPDDGDLIIVDFSLPKDDMLRLAASGRKLTWLDHHATSRDTAMSFYDLGIKGPVTADAVMPSNGQVLVKHDLGRSGAGLALRHSGHGSQELGRLVAYVEQRDLWKHKGPGALPWSDEFTAGLRLKWQHRYDDVPGTWRDFLRESADDLIALGRIALAAVERRIARTMPHAKTYMINGFKVIAVNNTDKEIVSDLGHRLLAACPDAQVSVGYALEENGWSWQLRSRNGEARLLAEQLGGGGHPNAAGANGVKEPPWTGGPWEAVQHVADPSTPRRGGS